MKAPKELKIKSLRGFILTIKAFQDVFSLNRSFLITICTLISLTSFSQINQQDAEIKRLYEEDVARAKAFELRKPESSRENRISKGNLYKTNTDGDDDGMDDAWENSHQLSPTDPKDAWWDKDSDGVINLFEFQLNSNPENATSPVTVNISPGDNVKAKIDAAVSGQLLRVQGGKFNVNCRTYSPKTIMIQGGWNSSFTVRDPFNMPTIFDGNDTDEVLRFVYSTGVSNTIIDGLTLTYGGGYNGALTFIADRSAISNLSLKDCKIINSHSTSTFSGSVFIGHWDTAHSEVYFVNTLIANDRSSAIYNQTTALADGRWKIINCTITNNTSTSIDEGFGLNCLKSGNGKLDVYITNSIIWGNQKNDLELAKYGGSITVNAKYSDIGNVNAKSGAIYSSGMGMINKDPEFVNPTFDYHLKATSPCIDKGIDIGLPFTGSAPDMGVFGFLFTGIKKTVEKNGIGIYPNPVIESLTIDVFNSIFTNYNINIFDVTGNLVFCQASNTGNQKLHLSLTGGLYFLKIYNEERIYTDKIVVQ